MVAFLCDGLLYTRSIFGKSICFYFMDNYMYFISWAQLFGYYMLLFHAETNAFSHRVTSYNRKSYRETSLDMSGENRKFTMKWNFPDESSDCHVISDELVFEVKFVSKVCQ